MAANAVVKRHPFDLMCLFFVYSDPIFEKNMTGQHIPSHLLKV